MAGGNAASTLNMAVGATFVLSGFVHLALLERSANILAFRMPNVLFSFAMGLLILTFGMYGRVSGGLPHDNPYWRRRHPEQAAREERRREEIAAGERRREETAAGERRAAPGAETAHARPAVRGGTAAGARGVAGGARELRGHAAPGERP